MFYRFIVAVVIVAVGTNLFAQAPLVAPTDKRTPEEERKGFTLPAGFTAQLVASEPDILKPMQMAFDAKGRLWVAMSQEYPWAAIGRPGKDRLMVLSEIGDDGKAKKVTTFADDLNIPIGVLPLPDCKSVLVSSIDPGAPEATVPAGCWIWKLTDTDDDGKADRREKLFGPFGTRDTHGMVNSFTLMPDGWVYACHGYLNESKVKGRDGHEVAMQSGHTFRFRPDGSRIEVFTRGQVNPFGMTFDTWFNFYTADCHSKPMTQLVRGAVYQSFGKPHDGLGFGPDMIRHDHGSTGLCGLAWYEAEQFPVKYRGGMFLGNVVNSRINWDKIVFHGSTPEAVQQPDFLVSEDLWFRPVDIRLGPDGALYVSDFYNKIIGHYEVDLKHPGRDRTSGRIWRIVYNGKDNHVATKPPIDITTRKPAELDKLLGHANIVLRMQATHALINAPGDQEEQREELRKLDEKAGTLNLYEAHKMWVDEAEPIGDHHRVQLKRAARDWDDFTGTHQLRLRIAQVEWEADRRRRGRQEIKREKELIKVSGEGMVARAGAEWMAVEPKPENLKQILHSIAAAPAADSHLRHALRIALRETLRDPAAWTALNAQNPDEKTIRVVANAALGLPTNDAAGFVTAHIQLLASDVRRLPEYVEHATRFGDGMHSLFKFVSTHKPDDLRLSVALFHAYQRAFMQKGGPRFDIDDIEYAEKLVARGLTDSDAATVQRCFDVAAGMKLKNSIEAVAAFAVRRDRPENQRAAAYVTLLALDQARGVAAIGRVLGSNDEAIGLREKAAQALGSIATPAAYADLIGVLEKAPARLQTVVAIALAGKADGAEQLLKAVTTGKASARLLQDRAVQTKLTESKLPKVAEQVAELTKGLPTLDQKMAELMNRRRAEFAARKPDAKLGAAVFKTHCANCHQLGNEGAKVGPQLDGLGARGLERLLEDILDPSRNVDQAMRSTTIYKKDNSSVSGLVLREEGELIVMADNLGKEVRVPKADVDERRTSLLSPMPTNLVETIKEDDFYHLMAFLLEQREKK